jgi:cobalamin biosynthesis protein CbiG
MCSTVTAERRVPWIDEDPAWVVPLPGRPGLERAAELLGALCNGAAAVRGTLEARRFAIDAAVCGQWRVRKG